MDVQVEDWGLISYSKAHQKQKNMIQKLVSNEVSERIITCSHPSVVTLGKQALSHDLLGWSGETIHVERGGKATYHGPEQIIIYPILNLKNRGQNLGGLLRSMERAIISTLKDYHISAWGSPQYAGVWLKDRQTGEDKKIASIGIAVKKWVSYHGLAFNLNHDPLAFQGIASCGHKGPIMTNLEEQLKIKVDRIQLQHKILSHFQTLLETDLCVRE